MQNDMQHSDPLTDLLAGQPVAVAPDYWHTVTAEVAAVTGNISPADIKARHAELMPVVREKAGGKVLPGVSLNDTQRTPKGSFAHLKLAGLMLSQDFLFIRGVNHLATELMAADANPNISGVLLEVDSGGGSVIAGQMLLSVMEGMSTPVVVLAHYMASAAVMATLPAAHIVASSPAAQVGSVGTLMQVSKSYLKAQQNNYTTIYAKGSTKKNDLLRAMIKGDNAPAQKQVDTINRQFITKVRYHRAVQLDTLTGAMFFATDAKNRGLIDQVGTYQDAFKMLQSLTDPTGIVPAPKKATLTRPAAKVKPLPKTVKRAAVANRPTVKAKAAKADPYADRPWMNSPINQRARELAERQKRFENFGK